MAIVNTLDAVKTITKAVPTLNEEGKVKVWDITVEYSLNDYISTFSNRSVIENPTREVSEFSKANLWDLVNSAHLDEVYESQYTSVKLAPETPSETVVSDFDINSLE